MRRLCFVLFLMFVLLALPAVSSAQVVGIAIRIGPPALPVYEQPYCPGPGYIWTPGYWAYGPDGYYWVPGTWVMAPEPGLLWTPGYWGWRDGFYVWHTGYWGPHVGFYGGVNYGFGYFGEGFVGGRWHGRVFEYNTSVTRVNTTIIHNTYVNNTVINNNVTVNRVSYNGGPHGINARPSRDDMRWEHERHVQATDMQSRHEHEAGGNRNMLYSANHGRPSIGATARPAEFSGRGGMASKPAGSNRSFTPPSHNDARGQGSNPHSFTPPAHNQPEIQGKGGNPHTFNPPAHNQPDVRANNPSQRGGGAGHNEPSFRPNNPPQRGGGNDQRFNKDQGRPHEGGGQAEKGEKGGKPGRPH